MRNKIITICTILVALAMAAGGLFWFLSTETNELEDQEKVGELIAEEYIVHFLKEEEESKPQESVPSTQETQSDLNYNDNYIYQGYDEHNAKGKVDCVIEIPAIQLRQSVFIGTIEQTRDNLSHWLAVTARHDFVLGETHYCIYMHNPRNKSIRISYAQETLVPNDYMVVTQKEMVYLYRIVDIFPEWRNKCTSEYVYTTDIPTDKLYIFTCAREEWQGRNLVIEGAVYKTYNIQDWNKNKDQYILDYKKDVGIVKEEEPLPIKEKLEMELESKDNFLIVSMHTQDYSQISKCSVGIFDIDGYLIKELDNNPIDYSGDPITINELPSGEYYIGVYEIDDKYETPAPYKVTVNRQKLVQSIISVDQEANENEKSRKIMKTIAIIMVMCAFIVGITIIIRTITDRSQKSRANKVNNEC